jgi:hypothetical protein
MWDQALELWTQRNKEIRNPELALQQHELEQQARNTAEDRGIFDIPLQERLRQQPQQLLDFINVPGRTILHSIKEAAIRAAANVRQLTGCFPPRWSLNQLLRVSTG